MTSIGSAFGWIEVSLHLSSPKRAFLSHLNQRRKAREKDLIVKDLQFMIGRGGLFCYDFEHFILLERIYNEMA